MRTHSPLVLDVRELLEHGHGIRKPIEFDARVPELGNALVSVGGPIHFDLVLESIDGGLLVQGSMAGAYTGECGRCVTAIEVPFTFKGAEIYRPASDEWEEGYIVKDNQLDLEPMVRDTVALNLPANPLCREDCQGLCSRCGEDLNEGPCECGEEVDVRWSDLKELGKRLNG